MSHDYGECRHCHTLNSYSVFDCHQCGARLPWADALTQKLLEGQKVATGLAVPPQWATPQLPVTQNLSAPVVPARHNACAHCGVEHSADAVYCPRCGTRVLSVPDALQANATPASVRWPLGLQQPATSMSNLPSPPAYLSPQQNVNVNVVTHQQDSHLSIKQKKRGGFAWRFSFVLFLIGGYLILFGAPFALAVGFLFAAFAVTVLSSR